MLFFVIQFVKKKNAKIFLLIIACLLGVSIGAARFSIWIYFNHTGALESFVNKKVLVKAVVMEEPQVSDNSSKIIAKTSSVDTAEIHTRILIIADRYTNIKYGDEIKISGKVMVPKNLKSDEGDFAYDVYLARQGIFYTMTFPSVYVLSHHHANIIREYLIIIKNNFLDKIDKLFSAPRSGLLAGLLVSGRSSLSKSEQAQFTRAGLIHIVALSGFNVTIIAQALMAMLIFLPKKMRLVIGAFGVVAFVVMTGFGSTVVRAGIMAILVIAAALLYRTYNVGRSLFIAVLLMTVWNPMVVFDVSFQLSCIATFAVIFAVPPVLEKTISFTKFLPEKFKIRETILGTAIIEIFLLPILLSTAGQISLVTVITNFLILPALPVVMGFGFFATIAGYVHIIIYLPLVAITNLMLQYILMITDFFANIPFGVVSYKIPQWFVFAIYFFLTFCLWVLWKNKSAEPAAGSALPLPLPHPSPKSSFTKPNLERLDNFFQSHSNSNFQKKL